MAGRHGRIIVEGSVLALTILAAVLFASFLHKALSYHEETIRVPSNWGKSWNGLVISSIVETRGSPWVMVDFYINEGTQASSGAYMVYSDTLVLVVSGPRREVLQTAGRITGSL